MPWVEVFVVFVVSHLVGDYLLQTEWQALNKRGGLTGTRTQRLALSSHIATYTIAYVPALVWLSGSLPAAIAVGAAIAIPHLIQDDGRLLALYSKTFKHADLSKNLALAAALDQSFHIVALFLTALVAGS
jgi:hypothetical protein